MSNMPERIWAFTGIRHWSEKQYINGEEQIEYIRADVANAEIERLKNLFNDLACEYGRAGV